ncbi:MAG: carboxynorspermidine decarboxylase [Bacteroidaceae bacterium]|nr:carboxynorspermidine decarboxylase [Bacteroidaceae bacterium]
MTDRMYSGIPTPCYVMEEEKLRKNLSLIQSVARRANVEIILAFKAFALWKAFPIFREYIHHTTASSLYEAMLAYHEFGSKAHTYSPAYTEEDFPSILECSSHITFNSFSQLEKYFSLVREFNKSHEPVSCGIRVNPEYSEVEVELYNPCAPGSRFGVRSVEMPDILPQGIEGFHCHCHCESSSYELERTLVHLEEKFSKWFPQLKWLNLGGGHLMTRSDYDVDHLVKLLNGLHERYPNLRIILEPGSAFAWQTGPLVANVVDVVSSSGIRTAVLNVSFTCHMPDCLEMPYQPKVRGAETLEPDAVKTASPEEHVYRLGGNSCLSGDFMGSWKFDHELQVGEQIILEDMIHYTTVKTTMFNGISHPSIGILHTDGTFELYRKFTYEDYKNRMC